MSYATTGHRPGRHFHPRTPPVVPIDQLEAVATTNTQASTAATPSWSLGSRTAAWRPAHQVLQATARNPTEGLLAFPRGGGNYRPTAATSPTSSRWLNQRRTSP